MGARGLPWVWVSLSLLVGGVAAGQDDHPNGAAGSVLLTPSGVSGRLETGGDRDVFRVAAQTGTDYYVETSALTGGCDTVVHLYDPQGQHLTSDDDGGVGVASRLTFSAASSGTYYVLVRHYDHSKGTGGYRVAAGAVNAPTTPAPAPAPTTPAPSGADSLSAARVFDPKLAGASLELRSRLASAGSITLDVRDGQGRLVRRLLQTTSRSAGSHSDAWDGRTAQGTFAAPGEYRVRLLRNGSLQSEVSVSIVRLGARALAFGGSARVPLVYHRADAWGNRFSIDQAGAAWAIERSGSEGCLDSANGSPIATPARWTNLNAPPRRSDGTVSTRGRSLPIAYRAGSTPRVTVTLGDRAVDDNGEARCGYPVANVPLRVSVEGGVSPQAQSGELSPGDRVDLDLPAAPSTVGKHRVSYRFRFHYRQGSSWLPVPGELVTEHTLYAVLARPSNDLFPGGRPWVAALDLVSGWAQGGRTQADVLAAVTRGVNASGLRYDVDAGAPAYTDAFELHEPMLNLDAFLANMANGRVVNCLDCASIVNKLAAQMGASTQITILGWQFNLHWLRGIGFSSFTHSLFGGYHGFSYHAVASPDRGATLYDACLELDDDSRPYAAPHDARLPAGVPFTHYRRQLSSDAFLVQDLGQASIR